ncbi:interferon-gamma-inducible GTPase 10-like [Ruditapes philippinarum]|uniref:interferon-gamma-inducible GTPase 10-like n=1 Tax=Ruditapes philippinarum TaxID=129788 RepID=UPI00295B67A6|nr:interferon-gamma-inducible GTPase 10-like [Ruditapes philippinarum]
MSLDTTVEYLRADLNLRNHLLGASAKSIAAFVSTLALSDVAESVDLKQYISIMGTSSSQPKQQPLEKRDVLIKSKCNIAITGNAGVGKSTLINSLRGLKANCEEAAAVGVDETTEVPMRYIHPFNENIVLWDLPGMGTQRFPKSTYLKDVGFDKFDLFLIITATRFTENDLWLANEVKRLGKKFFFIRTKIDLDVENDKNDNPEICKADTVSKIRRAMAAHVENGGFSSIKVFLIDSHFPQAFDFPLLIDALLGPFFFDQMANFAL